MAEFLPTRNCLQEDLRRSTEELEFLKGSYLQPELAVDRKAWPVDGDDGDNLSKKPAMAETFGNTLY